MAKEFKVKDVELKELLSEVEKDLKELLKTEQETLVKAEKSPEKSEESSSKSSTEESTSKSAETMAKEETSAGSKEESSSKEASSKEGSSKEGTPEHKDPVAPPSDGAPADAAMDPKTGSAMDGTAAMPPPPTEAAAVASEAVAADAPPMELHDFYAGLPDEELKEHYMCAKAALFDRMAAAHGGEVAAPPAPEAPMAPAMDAPEASMEKSVLPVQKSETSNTELDDLKKQLAEQDKAVNSLAEVLDKVLAQPMRKSIKGISELAFIPKSDDKPEVKFSKKEITEKLTEKSRTATLSKKDRELINEYCYGNVNVEQIVHLLKD